jgi:hypothetical protein
MKSRFVIGYLDNLIAWGDDLFRQDTPKSFNEAVLLYLLAANILGERRCRVPARRSVKSETVRQLKKKARSLVNTLLSSMERGDADYLALVIRDLNLLCQLGAICPHQHDTFAKRRKVKSSAGGNAPTD